MCLLLLPCAGDGSNAIKIFGQPARIEAAAAAAEAAPPPDGHTGGTDSAAAGTAAAPAGTAAEGQADGLGSVPEQQQEGQLVPSLPGAPWEQLCSAGGAHGADVNCVKWHPTDPTLLVSAGDDGVIKLWRLHRPEQAA